MQVMPSLAQDVSLQMPVARFASSRALSAVSCQSSPVRPKRDADGLSLALHDSGGLVALSSPVFTSFHIEVLASLLNLAPRAGNTRGGDQRWQICDLTHRYFVLLAYQVFPVPAEAICGARLCNVGFAAAKSVRRFTNVKRPQDAFSVSHRLLRILVGRSML